MILKNKYNELMSEINVTDEMHKRIMSNVLARTQVPKKVISFNEYKKYLSLVAGIMFLVVLTFAIPNISERWNKGQDIQVIPEIVQHESIQAMSKATGFNSAELTYLPFDVEMTSFVTYWDELAEVSYSNEFDNIILRTSMKEVDNSGDYTEYPEVKLIVSGQYSGELRGDINGYYLVVFNNDSYSFSISSSNPLEEDVFIKLIDSMKFNN